MAVQTRNNITDLDITECFLCNHAVIEGECLCTSVEDSGPQWILTNVRNKQGAPYEVLWTSDSKALVRHPGQETYYRVQVDFQGNYTCLHRSDYHWSKGSDGKCWPFSNRATCPHCDAALASRTPAPAEKPVRPYTLESLFDDYSAALDNPKERRVLARLEKKLEQAG